MRQSSTLVCLPLMISHPVGQAHCGCHAPFYWERLALVRHGLPKRSAMKLTSEDGLLYGVAFIATNVAFPINRGLKSCEPCCARVYGDYRRMISMHSFFSRSLPCCLNLLLILFRSEKLRSTNNCGCGKRSLHCW